MKDLQGKCAGGVDEVGGWVGWSSRFRESGWVFRFRWMKWSGGGGGGASELELGMLGKEMRGERRREYLAILVSDVNRMPSFASLAPHSSCFCSTRGHSCTILIVLDSGLGPYQNSGYTAICGYMSYCTPHEAIPYVLAAQDHFTAQSHTIHVIRPSHTSNTANQ